MYWDWRRTSWSLAERKLPSLQNWRKTRQMRKPLQQDTLLPHKRNRKDMTDLVIGREGIWEKYSRCQFPDCCQSLFVVLSSLYRWEIRPVEIFLEDADSHYIKRISISSRYRYFEVLISTMIRRPSHPRFGRTVVRRLATSEPRRGQAYICTWTLWLWHQTYTEWKLNSNVRYFGGNMFSDPDLQGHNGPLLKKAIQTKWFVQGLTIISDYGKVIQHVGRSANG
jgi:hypothetical protein